MLSKAKWNPTNERSKDEKGQQDQRKEGKKEGVVQTEGKTAGEERREEKREGAGEAEVQNISVNSTSQYLCLS